MIPKLKINLKNIKNKQYQTFNIKYTPHELQTLSNINIKSTASLNLYGLYRYDILMTEFFKKVLVSNDSKNSVILQLKSIIKKLIRTMMSITNKDSALVHIRAFKKTSEFDVPRWHQDSKYFDNDEPLLKLVTVLKGPPTMLRKYDKKIIYHLKEYAEKTSDLFSKYKSHNEIKKKEIKLRKSLVNSIPLAKKQTNTSALYFVNHPYAAIHSEPKIDEDRLFIAILPASKKDLSFRRKIYKKK